MMRADLSAARAKGIGEARTDQEQADREASEFLDYQDKHGLLAAFHPRRHTFISNLGKAHVPLTLAQKFTRRCHPKLTANKYARLEIADHVARTANPRPAKQ